MRRSVVPAVLAVALVAACGGGDSTSVLRSDAEFRQATVTEAPAAPAVVAASDALGLAVLRTADTTANMVFSPASAVIALTMLGEGATGEGARELDGLLGAAGDQRSVAVNALTGVFAPFAGDPGTVGDDVPERPLIHVANNVVLDDQAEVRAPYLDRLAEYHDAGVQVADLASEAGIAVLDAWVRENTGGRIEESAIVPDENLYLVLQDVVFFAARWEQEFDPGNTADGNFESPQGTQVVETMHGLLDARYAALNGWQAVELPYRDGVARARIILPPPGVDPGTMADETAAALEEGLRTADPLRVQLSLPRVDMAMTTELIDVLRGLGLQAVFDPAAAALEGISPGRDLHVGQAVQQATLALGEQGTVAAAATEIGVVGTSAPEYDVQLAVDRPFLLVVEETSTGWDLFQALVRSID